MANKIKVPVVGGNRRVITIPNATPGAQLGSTLLDTDGNTLTPAALKQWLGLTAAAAPTTGGTTPPPFSLANPTAKVGPAITNTSGALTAMYSDSAPAIDLTAIYAWTGAHSFSNAPTFGTALGYASGGTAQATWAKGDILYASAANTLSRLAAGSNGDVLTLASGVPSWASSGGGGGSLTDTYIGFGSSSNLLTGSADLTWIGTTSTLSVIGGGSGHASIAISHAGSTFGTVASGPGLEFYDTTNTIGAFLQASGVVGTGNYALETYCFNGSGWNRRSWIYDNGFVIVPAVTGVGTGLYVDGGDITASRSTLAGALFLGSGGSYVVGSAPIGSVTYGSVYVQGATNGYSGIIVYDNNVMTPTVMSDGVSKSGIYCQGATHNGWIITTAYGTGTYIDDSVQGGTNTVVYAGGPVFANHGGTNSPGLFVKGSSTGAGTICQFETAGGATCGYIENPTGTTVSLVNASDESLKENIADAYDPGELIDAIRVRRFDWIAERGGHHEEFGFIAQELHQHAPWAVSTQRPHEWGTDISKLVPMMMAELKMLRWRVAQLESA